MNPDKPNVRIVTDRISRDSRGRFIVTDWQQCRHTFRDASKAIAYAASLYSAKPKSIQAAKREPMARWTNPPRSIVWHYERHAFTSGRAIKSH